MAKDVFNSEEKGMAPMELMSQFLVLVSADTLDTDDAKTALEIGDQILEHEPDNRLIMQYKSTLEEFIEQKKYEAKMGEDDDDDDDDGGGSSEADSESDDGSDNSELSADSDAK